MMECGTDAVVGYPIAKLTAATFAIPWKWCISKQQFSCLLAVRPKIVHSRVFSDKNKRYGTFTELLNDERRSALFTTGTLSEVLTIANLRHTVNRIWTCAEPEFILLERVIEFHLLDKKFGPKKNQRTSPACTDLMSHSVNNITIFSRKTCFRYWTPKINWSICCLLADHAHQNRGSTNSADMDVTYRPVDLIRWWHHKWWSMRATLIVDDPVLAPALSCTHLPTLKGWKTELALQREQFRRAAGMTFIGNQTGSLVW